MEIKVHTSKYRASGWERMPVRTLHAIPAAAYELARERADGSIAPTDDEIENAVTRAFRVSGGGGTLSHGDVCVDRIEVFR